ncbi:hypothetical protein [Portibacter lacus]|uniref:Uncharacterized protein n=1 Tax=Portibacter lacus TaxID=1099794 RepID=A0AA37WFF1_9BACT|nr:hypothetical protein [Portibacter lacus]GLR18808.1 hypothetical protein GCM10007940_34240 [Portibacter lacus]
MADYSDKEDKRKQETIAFAEPETAENEKGKSLTPPSNPVSSGKAPIQKKDPESENTKDDKEVDVDVKVLPPSVQMAFWRFKLSADTGEAKLGYKKDDFSAGLGYSYGSALSLGVKKGPFSGKAAYSPGGSDFTLGAGYKQGPFNAGLSVNPLGQSASLSLGYGSPLLPMPNAFSSAMQSGGDAATNMMMQGPIAPLNDPMDYYNSNKGNIDDISKAAKMAADLAKQKKGVNFGVGMRLSASQLRGISFTLGAQGSF